MNVRKAPFNNLALRQAIAWAVDREEIRAVAYYGAGEDGLLEVPTRLDLVLGGRRPVPEAGPRRRRRP